MIARIRPDQKCILVVSVVLIFTVFTGLVNLSSLVFLKHTALEKAQEHILTMRDSGRALGESQAEAMYEEFAGDVGEVMDQAKFLLLISIAVCVGVSGLVGYLVARTMRNIPMPGQEECPPEPGDGST